MGRKVKAQCPHCGAVNDVDVDKELEKGGQMVVKMVTPLNRDEPSEITVTCENLSCLHKFKVPLR